MPEFDRFDICEAYYLFHMDYHVSGYATGRRESYHGQTNSDIAVRLSRINFTPAPSLAHDTLTDNGRDIYNALAMGIRTWGRPRAALAR